MSMMVFFALLLAAVQLGVLSFTVRLFRSERSLLAVAFFAFAAACSLLSTLYWAAYDLLRGDARMPFAANEICEWALFLLLASSLRAARAESRVRIEAAVSAALFAAANTALWIAWSGEWLQDILTGLSLGWLFYAILAAMSAAEALSRAERIGFGAAAVLVIAAQAMTFYVSGSQAPEVVCNVLLFAADAWLILKTVVSLKRAERR